MSSESVVVPSILLLEPFYGGSHKQLIDLLCDKIPGCVKHTMSAKKWHWRARTAALHMSQIIPHSDSYRTLFCSSTLNLQELAALRPDLGKLRKVIYFHENQLVYPVRKQQGRDFQYGYNQILSSLVADAVVFNSKYNMESFLSNIQGHLKLMPDYRPKELEQQIKPKCSVIAFPIAFPTHPCHHDGTELGSTVETTCDNAHTSCSVTEAKNQKCEVHLVEKHRFKSEISCSSTDHGPTDSLSKPLHIVWPHRWEHDKDPELFFETLFKLHNEGIKFNVSVLGEIYSDVPEIFVEARVKLKDHITNWGFQESKEDYFNILRNADVVVSTAKHEFFGVAMLEATYLECYPLCPNNLVYPEIFPADCLYNTDNQLYKKLKRFCQRPSSAKINKPKMNILQYSWNALAEKYKSVLT